MIIKSPSRSEARTIAKHINKKSGQQKRTARQIRASHCKIVVNYQGKILAYGGLVVENGRQLTIDFYVLKKNCQMEEKLEKLIFLALGREAPGSEGSHCLGTQYMFY